MTFCKLQTAWIQSIWDELSLCFQEAFCNLRVCVQTSDDWKESTPLWPHTDDWISAACKYSALCNKCTTLTAGLCLLLSALAVNFVPTLSERQRCRRARSPVPGHDTRSQHFSMENKQNTRFAPRARRSQHIYPCCVFQPGQGVIRYVISLICEPAATGSKLITNKMQPGAYNCADCPGAT